MVKVYIKSVTPVSSKRIKNEDLRTIPFFISYKRANYLRNMKEKPSYLRYLIKNLNSKKILYPFAGDLVKYKNIIGVVKEIKINYSDDNDFKKYFYSKHVPDKRKWITVIKPLFKKELEVNMNLINMNLLDIIKPRKIKERRVLDKLVNYHGRDYRITRVHVKKKLFKKELRAVIKDYNNKETNVSLEEIIK